MAKLTAAEVKKMLEPVAHFAPAVAAASEILAAVEDAEQRQAKAGQEHDRLTSELADLQRRISDSESLAKSARLKLSQEQTKVEQERQALKDSLKPLLQERDGILAQIEELKANRDTILKDIEAQKQNAKQMMQKQRDDLEAFKKRINLVT